VKQARENGFLVEAGAQRLRCRLGDVLRHGEFHAITRSVQSAAHDIEQRRFGRQRSERFLDHVRLGGRDPFSRRLWHAVHAGEAITASGFPKTAATVQLPLVKP